MPDLKPQPSGDFDRFDRRYRPALLAFFLRRLRDPAEAEDLTQEVLTRITAGGETPLQHPDAYVFQAAANLLRDRGRREQLHARSLATLEAASGSDAATPDPERIIAARQSLTEVLAALQELPERTRSIFILHRLEKLKKVQIADMFGLSTTTIDNHMLKAIQHLYRRLKETP